MFYPHAVARRRLIPAIIFIALFTALSAQAANTPDVVEILQKMDATISGYDDQTMDVEFKIIGTDKSEKKYQLTVHQLGTQKRLIKIGSGELKGLRTLIESRDRMYVFLPGFRKVRRVAAHNMNQTFAGSDFTNDDMAATKYADDYEASIDSETKTQWRLRCKPKSESNYSYLIITVEKDTFSQSGIEYYDKSGTLVKVFKAWNYTTFEKGAKRFGMVSMSDPRTGHETFMEIKDFRVNEGLTKSMFTTRHLQWGR